VKLAPVGGHVEADQRQERQADVDENAEEGIDPLQHLAGGFGRRRRGSLGQADATGPDQPRGLGQQPWSQAFAGHQVGLDGPDHDGVLRHRGAGAEPAGLEGLTREEVEARAGGAQGHISQPIPRGGQPAHATKRLLV